MHDTVPQQRHPDAAMSDASHVPDLSGNRFIAADVGGTWARLALVAADAQGMPQILAQRRYAGAEHASLGAILDDFRRAEGAAAHAATVAIAGVLDGDVLVNTNLPWPVAVRATARDAGLARLRLVNDFEAVAHAVAHVGEDTLAALNGDHRRAPRWPALVLGPGTGLGVALRLPDGPHPVLASEAGHAALAPGNALELQILGRLMQRWPHVDAERVLSGSGLMHLYPCLCEIRAATPRWTTPAQLVQAATGGDDALAAETLDVFCGWLGSVCGDLALAFGARSVYLTGGVAGHLADWLPRSDFRARFLAKGVLGDMLRQVPVWRVQHGDLGVLGAAALHLHHRVV